MNIKKVIRERDEAFTEFVLTGRTEKVRAYCRRYGVPMQTKKAVFAAGIYKAVQLCTDIPQEVKVKAAVECMKLGFNPMLRPLEGGSHEPTCNASNALSVLDNATATCNQIATKRSRKNE